jgi:hypothetical protein
MTQYEFNRVVGMFDTEETMRSALYHRALNLIAAGFVIGNHSRAGGDKRIVPENYWERQEGQHFVGTTRKRPGGYSYIGFSLHAASISANSTMSAPPPG